MAKRPDEISKELDSLIHLIGCKVIAIEEGTDGESPTIVLSSDEGIFPTVEYHLYKFHRFGQAGDEMNVSSFFGVEEHRPGARDG